MSLTISGGFTMTGGGFTLVAAPPAAATASWFAGGNQATGGGPVTTVSRVTYATDTDTATSNKQKAGQANGGVITKIIYFE